MKVLSQKLSTALSHVCLSWDIGRTYANVAVSCDRNGIYGDGGGSRWVRGWHWAAGGGWQGRAMSDGS